MSKCLSINHGQKLLDTTKKMVTDVLKTTSKRTISKTAEATGDLDLKSDSHLPKKFVLFASLKPL